jgi:hypothetical protein
MCLETGKCPSVDFIKDLVKNIPEKDFNLFPWVGQLPLGEKPQNFIKV